jgi:hypothetical protein
MIRAVNIYRRFLYTDYNYGNLQNKKPGIRFDL